MSSLFSYWLRTPLRRYGIAGVTAGAATCLQYALELAFGALPPFVLFFPTIIFVALLAGFGPGVFATLLSAASVAFFFWSSLNVFGTTRVRELVGLALFSGVGAGISRLAYLYRRRTARLQEYESVVQGLEEMIVVLDRDYKYVIANPAFLKYRGMTREQVIGRHVAEVIKPESFEAVVKAKIDECLQGKVVQYELQYEYPALGKRDLLISYFPIVGIGKVDRLACILQDITSSKEADRALRESEDRYRDLVEHSEDLLCTHDLSGNLLSVNPAPARILGYQVPELLKIPMRDLIAPEFREQFDQYLERMKTNGADQGLLCVLTRSGERRIWEYRNTLRTEGVPSPIVRGMAHDITERKRAESALRRREEDYRMFVAQSSEGIFREDLSDPVPLDLPEDEMISRIRQDSYVTECNDALARMYGFESEREMIGKRLLGMIIPDDSSNLELMREYIRGGFRVLERPSHEVDQQGNVKVFLNSMIGIVEKGKLVRTWGIQRDVTDQVKLQEARKEALDRLRKSEEQFRILVEQASDGIGIVDMDGNWLMVNSALAEMLGYSREEVLQEKLGHHVIGEDQPRLAREMARIKRGESVRTELRFRRKDGSILPFEASAKQLSDGGLLLIARDISDRKRAEEALQASEERFRVALKNSPISVFSQDRDLRYTWIYNPRLYVQQEIIGKTDDEMLGVENARRLTEFKRQVLETGTGLRQEVLIPYKGRATSLDITLEPLRNPQGTVIGLIGAAMDIARLRELADNLQQTKEKLLREKQYLESAIETELGFERIIGQSTTLREVLKDAKLVASTDSTVLLLGETGTGKELVARAIHSLSGRNDKSFIKLNCAAVPTGLLESELFGHEKGAFTGAVNQKIGRLELADKGTLFLDEIGEMSLELQPKLLRVLQDREFERLGGVKTLRVDVRIISATNRDLKKDVAEKKFREDLFYRLNVFPISLPPLRERRSDIPALIRHFVHMHAARMGKHIEIVPDETISVLQNWSWPGNIRELENVIERSVILTKGETLAPPPFELEATEELLDDNLTEMEREHILRVLRETNGVLSGVDGAAVRLGLKRTTLQSMLKRLGIEPQDFRRSGTGTFGGN